MYQVYMLRCADGTLYTGTALDADQRLKAHNAGRGAKYTRSRLPVELAYREPCLDKGDALRRELAIKALTRPQKEALMAPPPGLRVPDRLWYKDFLSMEALERRCYSQEHITPAAEAYAWYFKLPASVTAAMDGGRLAGFVNLFPVTEAAYGAIRDGSLNDRDLTSESMEEPGGTEGALRLFLSCAAVEPDYRGGGLIWALLQNALKPYLACEQRIGPVITDNVTPAGEKLSQKLGMRRVCLSGHDSVVYETSGETFVKIIHDRNENIRFYHE